jgi:penicillin amidase
MVPIYRRLALDDLYEALPAVVGPNYASNNWVVDGRHSASGKPILANDPHLAFGAPGYWYLARLETPQHQITGATAAGVPLVVIGHNERIAWGFTTTTADVEDLYVEQIDPADPGRYLTPQGSAPFQSRRETIAVKGGTPVDLTIRETRHGPVLSDALPPGAAEAGFVLALAATFTIPDDRSAEALWEVNRAADWPGFRAALRHFVGPVQNIVYADSIRGAAERGQPAVGPLRHRQQQDRAGQLSLFPEPRLGSAEPRRADRGIASGDSGADSGVERRYPGRHIIADGPAAGSVDDGRHHA